MKTNPDRTALVTSVKKSHDDFVSITIEGDFEDNDFDTDAALKASGLKRGVCELNSGLRSAFIIGYGESKLKFGDELPYVKHTSLENNE